MSRDKTGSGEISMDLEGFDRVIHREPDAGFFVGEPEDLSMFHSV